jgi:hypothetical protein
MTAVHKHDTGMGLSSLLSRGSRGVVAVFSSNLAVEAYQMLLPAGCHGSTILTKTLLEMQQQSSRRFLQVWLCCICKEMRTTAWKEHLQLLLHAQPWQLAGTH